MTGASDRMGDGRESTESYCPAERSGAIEAAVVP